MMKAFNTTGPCIPGEHYMVSAQERCADLMPLVDHGKYFCIHAPRQSGKTTMLQDFMVGLNQAGRYHCLYCSLEVAQGVTDEKEGIPRVVNILARYLSNHPTLNAYAFPAGAGDADPGNSLNRLLSELCRKLDKPLVLLFDEADCLSGATLISFLRQLRDGYVNRRFTPFIHSLALVGMRNIRDYKGKLRKDSETLGSASPFNIVKEALTLRNFTRDEIAALYAQHTEATGQVFPPEVVDAVDRATCGQPWLVNAIACEIVEKILQNDCSRAIAKDQVEQAIQNIILRRDTHIDSLMERLKEERIQHIIEPVITGKEGAIDVLDDDFQYASDLGLVKRVKGLIQPSNPIYAEVILRTLNFRSQDRFSEGDYPYEAPRYIEDGRLNMRKLLGEFQDFWRRNSASWMEVYQYKEAAPHLILLAFLQRVINAQGMIEREYAAGRGRMDILIRFKDCAYPIEIKVRRDAKTVGEGIEQLRGYMDTIGAREGWLILFDRRPKISWRQKISWKTHKLSGGIAIHCVGC
ncbi:MAG: AAA-like domain-containing protein [Candidatus Sumerlaeota bacterium]|nr:AAA-like domain-containing protein [Candidatus Sumerlaeota bacterium]